jgi:hypothetical protein
VVELIIDQCMCNVYKQDGIYSIQSLHKELQKINIEQEIHND